MKLWFADKIKDIKPDQLQTPLTKIDTVTDCLKIQNVRNVKKTEQHNSQEFITTTDQPCKIWWDTDAQTWQISVSILKDSIVKL